MIIVSNTSPINYLLLIEQIKALPELFGTIVVPTAVITELMHPGAPEPARIWAKSLPDWVEIRNAARVDPMFSRTLGFGEAATISLALEIRADFVLLDDLKARKAALARGLSVAGTLNILDAAADRKLLNFEQAITGLLGTNFRCSTELLRRVLEGRRGRQP